MKILIIPDVHGRDFWRKAVSREEYDKVIFLGDYTDPYYGEATNEEALQGLKDIIQFKKDNPDKCILLIGNHDCPYIWKEYGKALGNYWCRHDYKNHEEINKLFNDNLDLFRLAWECENKKYGKVLFTHAGVNSDFKEICGLNAEDINKFFFKEKSGELSNIIGLAAVSYYRGGYGTYGSIVWADINEHIFNPITEVYQIFGHTYSTEPFIKDNFAMLDDGGKHYYILDDNGITKINSYDD